MNVWPFFSFFHLLILGLSQNLAVCKRGSTSADLVQSVKGPVHIKWFDYLIQAQASALDQSLGHETVFVDVDESDYNESFVFLLDLMLSEGQVMILEPSSSGVRLFFVLLYFLEYYSGIVLVSGVESPGACWTSNSTVM